MKNNYCEACKYQFTDRKGFMLHVEQTHRNEKMPLPTSVNLSGPMQLIVMDEEHRLAWYLKASEVIRKSYGIAKTETHLEVSDHDKFMKLDWQDKELITKAIAIANRKK